MPRASADERVRRRCARRRREAARVAGLQQGVVIAARLAPSEQPERQLGRERREQDAVAVVAGRPDQALERAAADQRARCRACPGAGPTESSSSSSSLTPGTSSCASRSSSYTPPAVGGELEAALLDGGAEHVAAVAARHQVAALEAHRARQQPGAGRVAQAHDLALDRPHRDAPAAGSPRAPRSTRRPRAPPRSAAMRSPRAVADARSRARRAVELDARHGRRARAPRTPARSHARASARQHRRGSTEWSSGHFERQRAPSARAPARARAPRSGAGARRAGRSERRNSSWRSSSRASSSSRATSSVPVARSGRPASRSRRASSAANAGHIAAERRPSSSSARPASPNSTSATGASMPAATCDAPRAQLVALEQRHRHAPLARAPGDRETDDPAAHDRHVEALAGGHAR